MTITSKQDSRRTRRPGGGAAARLSQSAMHFDLSLARPAIHLLLHAAVPLAVALVFHRAHWRRAWLWLLAGWLIDVDHLLADPIYVPGRCSIGFHPLHRAPAALIYVALLLPERTRLLATGLLIHLGLDAFDCAWMSQEAGAGVN